MNNWLIQKIHQIKEVINNITINITIKLNLEILNRLNLLVNK